MGFEKKITEFEVLVSDERKMRLDRRREERQEERRRKWMREREEEEQRRLDELAIKEREEREAREAVEKEREREEYEKKKAELEEIERKKTQRESDVTNRDRMVRMREDKDKYLESLLKERKNVFEKKITEFEVLVSDERKMRLD